MCLCICIYQQHTYVFQLCSLRGQSNIGNPGAISAPSTQILVSKHQYPIIKLGLLGEKIDSRAGVRKIQDDPSLSLRKQGKTQKRIGTYAKVIGNNMKDFPMAKLEKKWYYIIIHRIK